MASTLPAVIAPVLGSAVIILASDVGQTAIGYRGVFGMATVFLALGAGLVLKVRENRTQSDSEPDTSDTPDTDALEVEQIAV
jgi:hypothetical protein